MLRTIGPDIHLPEHNVPPNHHTTTYNNPFPRPLSPLGSAPAINAFTPNDTEEDDCYALQTRLSIPRDFTAGMAENQGTVDG
jgi:hypothetical protein